MMLTLVWRLWQGSPLPAPVGGRRDVRIVSTGQRPEALSAARGAALATAARPDGDQAIARADVVQMSDRQAAATASRTPVRSSSARAANLSTARRAVAS